MTAPGSQVRLVPWDDLGSVVARRGNRVTRLLARSVARLLGWRFTGHLPELRKMVIIAAPHTSNWDFPAGIMFMYASGFQVNFFGKDTLFRPPLGWVMRWLGGKPVDRSSPRGVVSETVRAIREAPTFTLALAPEGTRKRVTQWRTGFWHVAKEAGLPIVLGYFDYAAREVGFGPIIWPGDDLTRDLAAIQAFYRTKRGKRPEQFATAASEATGGDEAGQKV